MRTTILAVLFGAFAITSAHAEVINMKTAKEVPGALVDLINQLNDRDLQLVGSSMESLSADGKASPITCEYMSYEGLKDKFHTFKPDETENEYRFIANFTDEHDVANLKLGKIGGFHMIGWAGAAITYGSSTVKLEPNLIQVDQSYTYIGANFVIPGKITRDLQYTFEISTDPNLTGTKIKKSLTVRGMYKRTCEYLVK